MHKTIKVQCQKVCNCWVHDCKTISLQYHVGLQLLHFVLQNTLMVQYQLVGSCCFCLCKIVHLWAANALRIWSRSREAHNRTVCSWVPYCETSKLQCQTVCSCWIHNCNTISSEHHMLYSSCTWYCKTSMVQYQLVGSCCFCLCKPVHVWVVNAQNNQGTVPKSLQLLSSWLQNNFSTVPRRLAVAAFRSAKHTHGTVPAGWQLCFCLCKAVHL